MLLGLHLGYFDMVHELDTSDKLITKLGSLPSSTVSKIILKRVLRVF
jgi:hypothetical protein